MIGEPLEFTHLFSSVFFYLYFHLFKANLITSTNNEFQGAREVLWIHPLPVQQIMISQRQRQTDRFMLLGFFVEIAEPLFGFPTKLQRASARIRVVSGTSVIVIASCLVLVFHTLSCGFE